MSETSKIVLRYWNCRGRVQSVRYMLADIVAQHKNVDFHEDTEVLEKAAESWIHRKADESFSGPFHNLPVLHWNEGNTFGQTLTIAQFLARKFNLYGKLTDAVNDIDVLHGYIDGVVSCAYTDIISNVLLCIWLMADFNDPTSPTSRSVVKISSDLKALNSLLSKSSTTFFYNQTEPTIADYFVFEAYTIARDYYSKLLPAEEDRAALAKLENAMKERPGLSDYFQQGRLYQRFTGSPKEAEYMAKLNASD